jgi:hypothetical protein
MSDFERRNRKNRKPKKREVLIHRKTSGAHYPLQATLPLASKSETRWNGLGRRLIIQSFSKRKKSYLKISTEIVDG